MAIEYLNNKVFEGNIARFKKAKQDKLKYDIIIEDISESIKNNVDKINLLKQKQQEYSFILKDFRDSQDQLAIAFFTLSQNIIRYRKFHFVDLDDAIQEFVMICFEKVDRFDPDRGSKAFNYMTTCVLNHYRQLYRSARNYNELKKKYQNHLQSSSENNANNVKTKSNAIAKDRYSRLK